MSNMYNPETISAHIPVIHGGESKSKQSGMSRMGHLVSIFNSASSVPYGTNTYCPTDESVGYGHIPLRGNKTMTRKYLRIKACSVLQY